MSKNDSKPANTAPADDDVEAPEWPKTLEWQGINFVIESPENWSLGTLRAFETGRQVDAIARVLGDAWSLIEDMPASKTMPLFDLIASTAGFGSPGE